MKDIFQQAKPHLIALGIFMLVCVAYFSPQLDGKIINQEDITAGVGMTKEVMDYEKETGKVSLWTNSMFGGMPTYQISSPQRSNLIQRFVEPWAQLKIGHPISWFFVGAVCFYILLLVLGVKSWMSVFGALAFALTTNQMLLYEAGHTAKFRAISYIPLVIAGLYMILEKRQMLGGFAVFLLALSLHISANHYQMTYYLALGMLLFMVVYVIVSIKNGELMHYMKSAGLVAVASVLAIGPSSSKMFTTYEYAQDTMRGSSALKSEASAKDADLKEAGLQWDYAMMWSNAPRDLLATFIPGVVGGSSGEPVDDSYEVGKQLGARGDKKVSSPMYWGGGESVSGPVYYGVVVFFFFILAFFTVKNKGFKFALAAAIVFISLISLGKYFEILQRILFENIPKYDNFRAHNSAMGVVAALLPIIAIWGWHAFFKGDYKKEELKKFLLNTFYLTGGFTLFIAILGPMFFGFEHFQDGRFLELTGGDQQNYERFMDQLISDRQKMMRMSALRSFAFISLSFGVLWFYLQGKFKKEYAVLAIGGLMCIDLFMVDRKYVNNDDFVNKTAVSKRYQPRQVDQQILSMEPKGRGYYRVFDISKGVNTFSSSFGSYFYNTVGGYSAVKLQRIQDVIDSSFSRGVNLEVANMLNTKYFITGENQQLQVNPDALGTAWFVNDIKTVNTATDELASLNSFNSKNEAIVHSEFADYMAGFKPIPKDSTFEGNIELVAYNPDRLVYKSSSNREEFVVFSEIYYGPNKGWKVTVDNEKADHIRANYLLRGMRIPAGEHEIIFEFKPDSYAKGETVSMAASIIILLVFFGWLGFSLMPYFKK
jgi:hypothetical protein